LWYRHSTTFNKSETRSIVGSEPASIVDIRY
jgi:hypothetical protein